MSTKTIVWIAVFIGSSIGSYVPVILGGSLLSFASVLWGGLGGILGLIVGLKLSNFFKNN